MKARYPICVKRHRNSSAERVVERFGEWLGMLEMTSLNKSYKMVVLRVLLDRDALWDGLEFPRLAAACRSFLEKHPALRADLKGAAFTRVPGHAANDMENFTAYWLKWPLSRWMDDQAGERWFARRDDWLIVPYQDSDRPENLRVKF